MKRHFYKLDEFGHPVPADWFEAGKLLADVHGRCVACHRTDGGITISTAFLVFDHDPFGDGPPLLWNTHVYFPAGDYQIAGTYTSLDEALDGHREIVRLFQLMATSGGAVGL